MNLNVIAESNGETFLLINSQDAEKVKSDPVSECSLLVNIRSGECRRVNPMRASKFIDFREVSDSRSDGILKFIKSHFSDDDFFEKIVGPLDSETVNEK